MSKTIIAAPLLAVAVVVGVAACDPATTSVSAPEVRHTAPATVTVLPPEDQAERDYFSCAAPLFGVDMPFDQAQVAAPAEFEQMLSAGRDLAASFAQLPAGTSVEQAATLAGLDAQGRTLLKCAVTAFGSDGAA